MYTIADNHFDGVLNKTEKIIWTGRPQQGLLLRTSDIFMIPFSLLWGGFAISWEYGVITSGAPFFFILWGIPFVLMGLYIIVGRFIIDMWQRSKTHYALTTENAIIISGLFNRQIKTLNLQNLPEVSLNMRNSGKGTITFGRSDARSAQAARMGMQFMAQGELAPAFELIEDAQTIYKQIKVIQAE